MTACFCDYDNEPAKAYWSSRPLARKAYRCDECGGEVLPGERYERVRAIWDRPETARTCVYCLAARDLCVSHMRCFCWAHFSLRDDIGYALEGAPPGLRFALGRLELERRQDLARQEQPL